MSCILHTYNFLLRISFGNLFDLIVNKGYLNEEEAANIIKQILSIVSYINSKNIVHRDLNLLNIFINFHTITRASSYFFFEKFFFEKIFLFLKNKDKTIAT